jgi:hypothetical protein
LAISALGCAALIRETLIYLVFVIPRAVAESKNCMDAATTRSMTRVAVQHFNCQFYNKEFR